MTTSTNFTNFWNASDIFNISNDTLSQSYDYQSQAWNLCLDSTQKFSKNMNDLFNKQNEAISETFSSNKINPESILQTQLKSYSKILSNQIDFNIKNSENIELAQSNNVKLAKNFHTNQKKLWEKYQDFFMNLGSNKK